jgi:hypothetical protein
MKKIVIIVWSVIALTACLSAQKNEYITVKAGTRVQDCIVFQDRYRFPEFTKGVVLFKNGAYAEPKLNYNFLSGNMEYAESQDTLNIGNPEEIMLIVISEDTFFYDQGYLELICSGNVRVAMKQYFELKEVLKKDSYGYASSNAATESYSMLETQYKSYKLITSEDRIFERIVKYYLAVSSSGFVPFTRKKAIQLFPQKKDAIQDYLRLYKVDFDSGDDLLRFAGFLQNL